MTGGKIAYDNMRPCMTIRECVVVSERRGCDTLDERSNSKRDQDHLRSREWPLDKGTPKNYRR